MAEVVVAGGSGFIGSAVVRRLVARGDRVRVMTAHPGRSADRIRAAGAEPVEGDLLRAETLRPALEGAEVVVQSLSFPSFPVEKPSRKWTFTEFEHHGTERLVTAAKEAGARRYVYVSGVGVAPDARFVWHRAKWAGERAILASGVPATIIRPSWAFGEHDAALNRFVTLVKRFQFVPQIGNGRQRINPVWVEDIAAVAERAAAPDAPSGVFEIGGPEVLTMHEILRRMLEVMGRRRPIVPIPAVLPKAAGAVLRYLPMPPLSPSAVDFLLCDAVADTTDLLARFPMRLTPLREGLATYLAPR
ncbi:MAG: NAD(P)H-binding protein [Actinomycetota bacterium]